MPLMLNVINAECHNAECGYAEFLGACSLSMFESQCRYDLIPQNFLFEILAKQLVPIMVACYAEV